MESKQLKRAFYTALITTGVVLGIGALILLGQTTQNSVEFGRLQGALLVINAIAALLLMLLIAGNLVRHIRDSRRMVPGTRLKTRMLMAFVGLAIAPLLIVYLFAVQFLNRGIETWFDVEMEKGLNDALVLSRAALDVRVREDLESTRKLARELAARPRQALVTRLGQLRRESGAIELTIFGQNGRIVATSVRNPSASLPSLTPDDVNLRVRQAGEYAGLDPAVEGSYLIRAVVALPKGHPADEALLLQALYPLGDRLGALADSVENTYSRYGELRFLRDPLKLSFTVTLTLVLLLSLLVSVYGAFFFARRLVAPIQSLVAGTRAVAEGDLDTRLPTAKHDEIGFLIDSFNKMIQRLANARELARLSSQEVEGERAKLEAILARLSTGVIAVDRDGCLGRANAAAATILAVDFDRHTGEALAAIANEHPLLAQMMQAFERHLNSGETEWREELTLRTEGGGRRMLVFASTELPADEGRPGGNVIVFDDVTEVMQAQRDAAWGEVARRLAHEIKNPLTPIQLSAERIRRRYLSVMKDMEAQVLDRATHTIVQQVEAMRDMVNAFSEYARAPAITISSFDLNQLVKEVAYLYGTRDKRPALELELDEGMGNIDADAVRVRQLLHNLIRNAIEALENRPDAVVRISTKRIEQGNQPMAEIRVSDNGPGIKAGTLDQIFEPYVTTKTKGTGLGLAIVKKLVEEHGGSVTAESPATGGAVVTVRLPANDTIKGEAAGGRGRRPDNWRERA